MKPREAYLRQKGQYPTGRWLKYRQMSDDKRVAIERELMDSLAEDAKIFPDSHLTSSHFQPA